MAAAKVRALTDQERSVLKRNGVDPERCSVVHRDDDAIVLINHKTRDNITIRQGDKSWNTY